MEAEERPFKMRKLSNDHAEQNAANIDINIQSNNVPANCSVDKVIEHSTDDAGKSMTNTENGATQEPVSAQAAQPMSKNQLKKIKRKAEWEAGREERKVRRREKDKEKKARHRLERQEAAQKRAETESQNGEQPHKPKRTPGPRKQRLPVAFVLDCGFDNLMIEKEIISLGSQITRSYSDNCKATLQSHLLVTGWKPETELRKRFDGLMRGTYRNWKGIKFIEGDWVEGAQEARSDMRTSNRDKMVGAFEKYAPPQPNGKSKHGKTEIPETVSESTEEKGQTAKDMSEALEVARTQGSKEVPQTKDSKEVLADKGEVIYLTSDSPNTLTELKPYHTYIIGGIVDKNRHKGICYRTAMDKNGQIKANSSSGPDDEPSRVKTVKTAKLPIGDYMAMTSRHVLATNHVVEIMLKWLETNDWSQAFLSAMPKRKGGVLKTSNKEPEDAVDESGPSEGEGEDVDVVEDDDVQNDDIDNGEVESSTGSIAEAPEQANT